MVLVATPGQALELPDSTDAVTATGTVDAQGSLLWRELAPGDYTVRDAADPTTVSDPAVVTDFDDPTPDQSFYDGQSPRMGFQYVTTALRAGSRVRITVDAPGNARPLWAFDTISRGEKVEIATDRVRRSKVALPVVSGVRVPGKAPGCVLRGQPCRTYPP